MLVYTRARLFIHDECAMAPTQCTCTPMSQCASVPMISSHHISQSQRVSPTLDFRVDTPVLDECVEQYYERLQRTDASYVRKLAIDESDELLPTCHVIHCSPSTHDTHIDTYRQHVSPAYATHASAWRCHFVRQFDTLNDEECHTLIVALERHRVVILLVFNALQ